ncbi:MFS transporter [Actinoallomurus iriomotensis]|uniref:Sugar transporter n=1 Tax=Actinoallomurus iriomotensis TaxID=478107 RepID=A0A9W6W0D3_9ACTN|nr:MFS transporter [Actinoallomurus iriomotensis]GLY86810.1 sugar transporter [Actinoallomurus iriomotensis]
MALSRALVRLLALTCGVTIANIYYAQPLVHGIAHDLGTADSSAGALVTATQLGYAAGLLLVVPLGDIIARRPLLTTLLTIDAVALAATAVAPGLTLLSVLAVVIGLSSVVVQMLIPYAATLAAPHQRAGIIGTLMGALLLGILLSRTFAGVVAGLAGWRGVYAVAAGLMTVTAIVVGRVLPADAREVGIGYLAQMRAVVRLARGEPVLRRRSLVGAAQFAAFSCFWTTVTFLLSGRSFGYTQTEIGLFALVGAAGAGCVLVGGRLLDRHRNLAWQVTGAALVLMLASFGVLAAGTYGLVWLVVGALLMDACSQAVHVTNQAVLYDLVDGARSRITTVYMTVYFVGGALGTTTGTAAYGRWGWGGACAAAAGFCVLALLAWSAARRHERPAASGVTEPRAEVARGGAGSG